MNDPLSVDLGVRKYQESTNLVVVAVVVVVVKVGCESQAWKKEERSTVFAKTITAGMLRKRTDFICYRFQQINNLLCSMFQWKTFFFKLWV